MKHIPIRTCIVCRQQKERDALVRLVFDGDCGIAVDATGKLPGRGAYVCKEGDCASSARKKRSLDRAFKTKIPDSEYVKIAEEINAIGNGNR
ncbi:MAG: YlxR family protein [Clostridiales bacterium]|nr:YlxR family protein [Clostridiales bacterium]